MNPDVKTKWIVALRSGEYKQCSNGLRRNSDGLSYCCLGVLCDLHAKETGNTWTEDNVYLGRVGFLPEEVKKWAGLDDSNPEVTLGFTPDSLSSLNDTHHRFPEIAQLIEQSL